MPKLPLSNIEAREKLNALGIKYDFNQFEYNGSRNNKSVVICPEHGVFEVSYHFIMKSQQKLCCKKCRNEHQQLILFKNIYGNDFDFKQHLINLLHQLINNDIDFDKIPDDKYWSRNHVIKLWCKQHGEFNTTYNTLKNSKGCPDCEKNIKKRSRRTYDLKYIQDLAIKHKGICVSNEYQGMNAKYDFICENQNCFSTTLRMLVDENKQVWCNCKLCNPNRNSKAEDIIKDFLDDKNITYVKEKRFDDCKSDKNIALSFDFWLPDFNACIEYDGKQHYEPIKYFGGKSVYQRTIINDNVKNQYCNNNNILLIRIPYWENLNIITILTLYLIDNQVFK